MKSLIASICILGLVGMVVGVVAQAQTADVAATVTPKLVSVSVSDAVVAYGILGLDTTKNTVLYHASTNPEGMDPADTQTATNDSNVNVSLGIKSTDAISSTAGTDWNLATAADANEYVHEFSSDGGSTWPQLPVDHSYATLAASVAPAGTQDADLQITTPTSTTGSEQRNITVTILATEI